MIAEQMIPQDQKADHHYEEIIRNCLPEIMESNPEVIQG